ncbi:MAG: AMP-binding protein [Alphaproteobacteria bacterium]
MNIAALLQKTARTFGDRPALARGRAIVADYRGFARSAATLAAHLRGSLRLNRGDRVAIAMTNGPDYQIVKYATWYAGLCAVPINAKLHRKEFEFILANSGARVCFVTADMETTLGGLEREVAGLERIISAGSVEYKKLLQGEPASLADVEPTDPAWLFYTSGTTGRPKGATLSHRNLVAMTMNYFTDVDQIAATDCIIHAAAMSHGSGCYGVPHVAKGAVQVTPDSGHFDPAEMLDLIQDYKGCSFFFAPTMVVRLLQAPKLDDTDLSNLKTVIYGGGPMYVADMVEAIRRMGQKFVQIYGQGEAPMTISALSREVHMDTQHPRYMERLGSVGTARTDVELRVIDADGRELPAGEIGEVVARGDVVMQGYWMNPEATAASLKGGWLHTGDMGSFDEDGFLTLKDRSKDMIISGGSNIYPREVEEVLLKHPDVLEVSVVGNPHPDWGEEVIAFVVAQPGRKLDQPSLDKMCLDHIARFKRPKQYRFVEALPKNNYGKILKTELRKLLAEEK